MSTPMATTPTAWVSVDDPPTTQLTYGPRVSPAPLTASVAGREPTLGSLEVVVTNAGISPLAVTSVTFQLPVGVPGPSAGATLTPTTEGLKTAVSDANWAVTGPPVGSPITSGTASYVLGPQAGSTVTLAAGASVVVQLYDFQTVGSPGTATLGISEVVAAGTPQAMQFNVTTFPNGFYFDSLMACVASGSGLVPVAQIENAPGTVITLTWNSSIVDSTRQQVFYSSAQGGQQGPATPSELGRWKSPPLTSDTTFVVIVTAHGVGGQPLNAALATTVSVHNPDLVAKSVSAGSAEVSGALQADSAVVTKGVSAHDATLTGQLTAAGATVTGDLTVAKAAILHDASASPVDTLNIDVTSFGTWQNSVNSSFIKVRDVDSGRISLLVRGDGYVGVGTDELAAMLTVAGDLQVNGNILAIGNVSSAPTRRAIVLSAIWGATPPQGSVDVAQVVQALLDSGARTITADVRTLGTDPAHGFHKHFVMTYLYGGSRYTAACDEYGTVSVMQRPNPIVIDAVYGDNLTSVDVTATIQAWLNANPVPVNLVPSAVLPDPASGRVKLFGMTYLDSQGNLTRVTSRDSDSIPVG